MTYTTPELNLVGSAQNLVLGDQLDPNTQIGCRYDDVFVTLSDVIELW